MRRGSLRFWLRYEFKCSNKAFMPLSVQRRLPFPLLLVTKADGFYAICNIFYDSEKYQSKDLIHLYAYKLFQWSFKAKQQTKDSKKSQIHKHKPSTFWKCIFLPIFTCFLSQTLSFNHDCFFHFLCLSTSDGWESPFNVLLDDFFFLLIPGCFLTHPRALLTIHLCNYSSSSSIPECCFHYTLSNTTVEVTSILWFQHQAFWHSLARSWHKLAPESLHLEEVSKDDSRKNSY